MSPRHPKARCSKCGWASRRKPTAPRSGGACYRCGAEMVVHISATRADAAMAAVAQSGLPLPGLLADPASSTMRTGTQGGRLGRPPKSVVELLLQVTVDEHGCWRWRGTTDRDGYASLWRGGRPQRAHRVMYNLYRGAIPDGLVLDHLCRVRDCVNPHHLEAVTNAVNVRRGGNATKTVCVNGHDLTRPGRVHIDAKGWRVCRDCAAARARARYARRRDADR